MSDYNFSSLNDKEFEELTTDLLTCHLGARVERFKSGRDGGVDGRFFSASGDEVIVQCKHWIKSGLPALMRSIESTEASKVKKINPGRYIFVTSLELSRANKLEIKKLFSPYILNDSDVFGCQDLNDILSRNPSVERKHYKLWISSTNVLQTILNSAIVGRSRHKLEEIIEESSRYVVTQSHSQAMEKLEKVHSVIITGSPGVGKTTLADQLSQFYTAKGYEFCFIENSLNEAEDIYSEESQQVFYFDDFLGRNFLLALNSHQDSHVINFIKRVEKDKKKRFILTSRSNILNQGKRLSDLFEIKKISRNEYELSISLLTDMDKARILYNHIWFGDLSEAYINQIYKDERYLKIINHKNFNPRLISFITDQHRVTGVGVEKYWDYIYSTLSNPRDVWRNVFDVQIDDMCRHIVVAVSLHGKSITEEYLRGLYSGLASSDLVAKPARSYDTVVKLLTGALLNRSVSGGDISYDLFNPSIADFVISNYLDEFNYVDELLMYLRTPQSISNLNGLMVSGVIEKEYYLRLLDSQLSKSSSGSDGFEIDSYKLRILASAASLLMSPSQKLIGHISVLVRSALSSGPRHFGIDYFEFVAWAYSLGLISADDQDFKTQLRSWVFEYDKDFNEFVPISGLVVAVDVPASDLTEKFKEQYIEILSIDITRDAIEAGVLSSAYDPNDYDYSEILDYVDDRLSELSIAFDAADIELVSSCCDVEDIIQSNINSSMYEDQQYEAYKEQRYDGMSTSDAINDLFDRS
jgi:adenylate kinase family enzyme